MKNEATATQISTANGRTFTLGAVVISGGDSVWLDCPNCQRVPVSFAYQLGSLGFALYCNPFCSTCGERGKIVRISLRKNLKGNPRGCNGSCLHGKTSCDCKCQGRCHGQSACRCAA
jgi:hypothetical protein